MGPTMGGCCMKSSAALCWLKPTGNGGLNCRTNSGTFVRAFSSMDDART